MTRCRAGALLALTVLMGGAIALTGCNHSRSTSSIVMPPAALDAVGRKQPQEGGIVAADNAFGFDVLGQLVSKDAAKNVFVSPVSLALALAIVENGAKEDTLAGIAQTLHLNDKTVSSVNTANAALQASLISTDPQTELNIANSLWLHKDRAQVLPAFITANTTYYGSDIGDLAGAPDAINRWVSRHTNGKITSVAGPDDYAQPAAMIVSAVYFKGKWTTPFERYLTHSAPFTRLDGTNVSVQMMSQTGTMSYYKGEGFQAVRLPYGSKRLSLIVAMPDKSADWTDFLANLSPDSVNTWAAGFREAHGDLGLPRFQSEYSADLKTSLSTLGMERAFNPDGADLSGLAANTYVKDVKHKTLLKVDEEGAEAAGVTSMKASTFGIVVDGFKMTMDHPFFCAIRDDKTGALLFMGVIVDPTATRGG